MASDPLVSAPAVLPPAEAQQAQTPAAPDVTLEEPTAEQVRAADQVFTETKEQQDVAALIGVWTSAALLHDLAKDALYDAEADDPRRLRPQIPDPKEKPEDGGA
jgi:hypothetical protein